MFFHICLIVCAMHSHANLPVLAQSYRSAFSHAVPTKNVKLSATPMLVLPQSSALTCARNCLDLDWCKSFNHDDDDTCELLDTFLCEGNASLVAADKYSYYDVERDVAAEVIENYINRDSCVQSDRCSPKCGCDWTAQFTVFPGAYISGFTDWILRSVTLNECQNACAGETQFLCKSIDYNNDTSTCYLSTVNRADQPASYSQSTSYIYSERVCQ